jgi:hypothetical protein
MFPDFLKTAAMIVIFTFLARLLVAYFIVTDRDRAAAGLAAVTP